MRVASIDVGTNTVLLLIADVEPPEHVRPLVFEQRLPRLGRDVDRLGRIGVAAFDRIAWILNEYKTIAIQHRADRIVAAATSAVRDATNRQEFLTFVERAAGIHIEVLKGEDEALLTFRGVASAFPERAGRMAVLDVGGGSTEITFPVRTESNGGSSLNRYSLQLGSVRVTERFFKSDPPSPEQIKSARSLILEELSAVRNPGFEHYELAAVAGTATTLACLDQELNDFDEEKVSGYWMSRDRLAQWFLKLCELPSHAIRGLSDATEGRADILTAGVLILNEIVQFYQFRGVTISERGLRYGLAIRELER